MALFCPVCDITFAAELPKLSNISIGNYVPDLSPLYACRKLAAVTISAATDAEVNALLDAIGNQLTDLGLNGCAITDATLTRIAGLRLQGLMLDSAHVSSLAPVWNSKTCGVWACAMRELAAQAAAHPSGVLMPM